MKHFTLISRFKVEIITPKGEPTGEIINIDVRDGANWAKKNGKAVKHLAGLTHNTQPERGIKKFRNTDQLFKVRKKEQFLWDWSKPEGQRKVELDKEIKV